MSEYISAWLTSDKKQTAIENTKQYKSHRVDLAIVLKKLLEQYQCPLFVDGGTALGAYRNQKMIPHDDDFDYGIYGNEELLIDIAEKLQVDLENKYLVRTVDNYCKKLEIYDPACGKVQLAENIDFYNVTVDLLLFKDHPEDDSCLQMQYFKTSSHKFKIPKHVVFPLSETKFETHSFPCPGNLQTYLEICYGYLGEDAYYDPQVNLYKKIEQ